MPRFESYYNIAVFAKLYCKDLKNATDNERKFAKLDIAPRPAPANSCRGPNYQHRLAAYGSHGSTKASELLQIQKIGAHESPYGSRDIGDNRRSVGRNNQRGNGSGG